MTLRSRSVEPGKVAGSSNGNGNGSAAPATNGLRADDQPRRLALTSGSVPLANTDYSFLDPLLAAISVLSRRVEQANASAPQGADDRLQGAVSGLIDRIETLPELLAAALSDALERQHRLIIKDMQTALNEFEARLEPSADTAFLAEYRHPTGP